MSIEIQKMCACTTRVGKLLYAFHKISATGLEEITKKKKKFRKTVENISASL